MVPDMSTVAEYVGWFTMIASAVAISGYVLAWGLYQWMMATRAGQALVKYANKRRREDDND